MTPPTTPSTTPPITPPTASLDAALRLGDGFRADERPGVLDAFARLEARLKSFSPGSVELLVTVKDRDGSGQRTTLEVMVAGSEPVIASSHHADLDAALLEVRDEAVRQITDATNKTEARNNRRLRGGPKDKRVGERR